MGQTCCYGPVDQQATDLRTLFYVSKDAVEIVSCDIQSQTAQRLYTWDYLIKPEAKYCALHNGKLMITGGRGAPEVLLPNKSVFQSAADVIEYCPVTNRLTLKDKMKVGRQGHTLLCDSEAVYALSGFSEQKGTKSCERYSLESETWEGLTDLNAVRIEAAGCLLKTKMYIVGGSSQLGLKSQVSIENYDFVLSRWLTLDLKLPSSLDKHACVPYLNGILVFGGYHPDDRPNQAAFWLSVIENRVMQKPGLNYEGQFTGQVVVSGARIYAYESKAGRRLFIYEDGLWTVHQIKITNLVKESSNL